MTRLGRKQARLLEHMARSQARWPDSSYSATIKDDANVAESLVRRGLAESAPDPFAQADPNREFLRQVLVRPYPRFRLTRAGLAAFARNTNDRNGRLP